jgi:hydrogenase/urease accessory protein HupE
MPNMPQMKKGFVTRGVMLCGMLWVFLTGISTAHSMKQVRSEISVEDGKWNASVWLEGWALYPEDGPKIPPGTPGDPNTAGRKWLKTMDAADHGTMRGVAEYFLGETFVLTLDGKRLEAKYSFPDYTESELPELEENGDGNTLMRIDFEGVFPEETTGLLELVWADDEDEPLVLQIKKPEPSLLRIEHNQAPELLMEVGPGGELAEAEGTTLFGWIKAGFEHIIPKGLDHICFILGLFLLQAKARPLLWQTSSFTIAHSITLALVVLGMITVPSSIVEPAIALSIAYVGIENLWVKELKPWRIWLVFALGLLHGMGFASVMKELKLPDGEVIRPLIGFNLGVEAGQITVLAGAFALTFWMLKREVFGIVRKIASGMIAVVGLYWTVERIWAL